MSNLQRPTVANANDNEDTRQQQPSVLQFDDKCNSAVQSRDFETISSPEIAPGVNTNESAAALLPRTPDDILDDMLDSDIETLLHETVIAGNITPDDVHEAVMVGNITPDDVHEAVMVGNITPDDVHEAVMVGNFTPDDVHEAVMVGEITHDEIHKAVMVGNVTPDDVHEAVMVGNVTPDDVHEAVMVGNITPDDVHEDVMVGNIMPDDVHEAVIVGNVTPDGVHEAVMVGEITHDEIHGAVVAADVTTIKIHNDNSSLTKDEYKAVDNPNKIVDTIAPTKDFETELNKKEHLTNIHVNKDITHINKDLTSIDLLTDKRAPVHNDESNYETQQVKVSYPLDNKKSDERTGILGTNQSQEANATVDDTSWASASTSLSTVNSEMRDPQNGILTTDQKSTDLQFSDESQQFTENFKSALVSAETNVSSPSTSTQHTYQPLRRARLRIGNQIHNLQEQLKTASSSGTTSSKTIEKLKQQLVEAKEMSMSFENIRKQRSISRPTKPTSHHLSHLTTPGKVERPYRQWQTLSPCVSTDSRYIFSSKEDRKSKVTPFMKVKVKTSDHLYAKRFQNLTGNTIPNGPKALINIVEEVQGMHISSSKAMCDSEEDSSLFPCTKQLVSQIETRKIEPDPAILNKALSHENETVELAVLKPSLSNPTVKSLGSGPTVDLERSSQETVALGREAAFYHRKDKLTDTTALGRRHSMLISGTAKPYSGQANVDDDLSFLDLHNRQLTMNERFDRASKRINAKPKTDIQQRIVGPAVSPAAATKMPSPVLPRDRHRSPGATMMSLASDIVYGPDDDADSQPNSTSKSPLSPTRRLPTYARGSRAHDTTPYHPLPTSQRSSASRARQADTQSRLRRHKERSLHRLAFRAGSRSPNYGVYMKAATEYIERVEHGVHKDDNKSLQEEGAMPLKETIALSCASITDSKEAPNPVVEHSNIDETTSGPQRETVGHFMQKIHREKKKSKGTKYITVVATKDHPGQLPGQLSFRAGQAIQLRCPEFEPSDGLCYGHFKMGRFKKKKKGLFPISHVGFESDLLTAL